MTSLGSRSIRRGLLLALVIAASAVPAGPAWAAFGDAFGVAPINSHPAATDTVPALPDQERAFWAGACDRSAAPLAPADPSDPPVAVPGGVGAIPPTILSPNGAANPLQIPVAAPPLPPHCIDYGAPALYPQQPFIWQKLPSPFQPAPAGDYAPRWRLAPVRQAGAHPDGTTMFAFARIPDDLRWVDGSVDNVVVDLPPGFVGNPQAVPECEAEQFAAKPLMCPPEAQVGVITLSIQTAVGSGSLFFGGDERVYPVYNLEPRPGRAAELGFGYASGENAVTVRLTGKARTNGDFGITAFTGQIPAALVPTMQSITLWGVPWAAHNDRWRPPQGHQPAQGNPVTAPCNVQPGTTGNPVLYVPPAGMPPACQESYDPSWGDAPIERVIRPFLTSETDCNPAPTVRLALDSFQNPGRFTAESDPDLSDPDWKTYTSLSPSVTGCADLPFEPDISFAATSSARGGASGLDVDLATPQNNDPKAPGGAPLEAPAPGAGQGEIDAYVDAATDYWQGADGLAMAHLKDSVVTMPPGVSVNPSSATGLDGCGDGEIGLTNATPGSVRFNNEDPFDDRGAECPDGSIIGTARVDTPLLAEPLTGEVVLGAPKSTDPRSGEMFRLFLVVRNKERGLIAKIYGSTTLDPATGQIRATFLNNPEVPFDRLRLRFKAGPRGVLKMPPACGEVGWTATFTPWSGGDAVDDGGAFPVDADCGVAFAPRLHAGSSDDRGRAEGGRFAFELNRADAEPWFERVSAELPLGFLAAVRDVPLCTDAQAAANACPEASRIGFADASSGAGDPFVLERKASVYLTEGYRGAPYGLAVSVPVEAGPFRGPMALDPIVVRQAVHVDRTTAQVTVESDPLPLIHHGVILAVRRILVVVDRPGFTLNPSSCEPQSVRAALTASNGETAAPTSPFALQGCASLPYRPRFGFSLRGRRQMTTGRHPRIRAVVTQRAGEAGIGQVVTRLPKSLALDPNNAQALCEFADGTKPDLENHCPKGSIVGRARAVSPLLKRPLAGDVYFVKNIRIDPRTGNQIRTLPMIVVALRGEVAINLRGDSDARGGRLISTFANVPDAPISRFELDVFGGRNGIIAVTRTRRSMIDLCRGRHVAEVDTDAHSGRRHDFDARMRTPSCGRRPAGRAACRAKRGSKRKACLKRAARRKAKAGRAARPASR